MTLPRGSRGSPWSRLEGPPPTRVMLLTIPRAYPALPRRLRRPRHDGRASHGRDTLASGPAPRCISGRLKVAVRLVAALGRLAAARDVLAGDHVLVAHPGGNHRVDVRALVDHHLEEGRPGEADERLERRPHLAGIRHAPGEAEAIGLRRLDEV